jgi:hypothetical protein
MNITLPEMLQAFVDSQAVEGGYVNGGDYIGALIRAERDRQYLWRCKMFKRDSPPGPATCVGPRGWPGQGPAMTRL